MSVCECVCVYVYVCDRRIIAEWAKGEDEEEEEEEEKR